MARAGSLCIIFSLLLAITAAAGEERPGSLHRERTFDPLPLRNWEVRFIPEAPGVDSTGSVVESEGAVTSNAIPSAASHFIAVVPCRVVDTRNPDGPYGGPKLIGTRSFDILGGPCADIPTNAAAYSFSIGVTETVGNGAYLTMWPTGETQPTVATVSWNEGQTLTTAAIVPAGTAGSVDVTAANFTHMTLDINGYFVEGVVTSVTAGTGLAGGGTGATTLEIATGGVGAAQIGASAVTTGAIADAAVTGSKIANSQVVRSVKGLTDAVDIVGGGGTTVTAAGNTITVSASSEVPSGTFVLGPPNDTTLIGSGYSEAGPTSLDAWSATSTTGAPAGRTAHSAVWTGSKMIIWGGYDFRDEMNTGGQYDPVANSWTATSTTGAPSPRKNHTAVWTGTTMVVWGGDPNFFHTGGQYDPVGDSWSTTSTDLAPLGRTAHTAVWSGTRMIIWGGRDSALNELNTGGSYYPAGNYWVPTSTTGAPSPRDRHSAVWVGTKMIIWGGIAGTVTNTGGLYHLATDSWSATSTTGAPSARTRHTAVAAGSKMIVWGGGDGDLTNTGGVYDPATNLWTATSTAGAPTARRRHTVVWTGNRMVVWGGEDTEAHYARAGGQYDPAANSWIPTSTTGAPSPRYYHSAVWTGTRMIIWGGFDPTLPQSGGAWMRLSLYRKN